MHYLLRILETCQFLDTNDVNNGWCTEHKDILHRPFSTSYLRQRILVENKKESQSQMEKRPGFVLYC